MAPKSKADLAFEMVVGARQNGIRFSWVGMDGGYGKEPALLRRLADHGEVFVADVHKDQQIYTGLSTGAKHVTEGLLRPVCANRHQALPRAEAQSDKVERTALCRAHDQKVVVDGAHADRPGEPSGWAK